MKSNSKATFIYGFVIGFDDYIVLTLKQCTRYYVQRYYGYNENVHDKVQQFVSLDST